MKKNPIISFASNVDYHPLPKPARTLLPEWYKRKLVDQTIDTPVGLPSYKKCMPFLDSLSAGYILELWCDIHIARDEQNNAVIHFKSVLNPVETRPLGAQGNLPVPSGHNVQPFVWKLPYYIQTPKEYSTMIVHPLNRFDLPFTTLSGLVDTDEVMYAGNLPFFIRDEFEGTIPKGTPIAQVIPFKRETWESIENKNIIDKGELNRRKSFAVFFGWYKKEAWKQKQWN
jgi:hypothetical protein